MAGAPARVHETFVMSLMTITYPWCPHPSSGSCASTPEFVAPIIEYDHTQFLNGGAVIGGYVYRGTRYPDLWGQYFYGDYALFSMWTAKQNDDSSWTSFSLPDFGGGLGPNGYGVTTFGQDEDRTDSTPRTAKCSGPHCRRFEKKVDP